MIAVILVNSISLAFYDYSDRDSITLWNQNIDMINVACTAFFIAEATLKIIAMGFFFHRHAYLRNSWNIIDALVVTSGIIELGFGENRLKSLRILRIFRPLKTINQLPGIKSLVISLLNSIPEFANIVAFLTFVFVLFATIGLHQYNGAFYNACRINPQPESPNQWDTDLSPQRLCTQSGLGNFQCPMNRYCGNPEDYSNYSASFENMDLRPYVNYGITNLDNIGRSLLTVFQIVTSDTWYGQMCNFMDADIPILGFLYCFLLIIVGQFFLMNLFLAVIVFSFVKSQQEELQKEVVLLQQEQELIRQEQEALEEERRAKDDIAKRSTLNDGLERKNTLKFELKALSFQKSLTFFGEKKKDTFITKKTQAKLQTKSFIEPLKQKISKKIDQDAKVVIKEFLKPAIRKKKTVKQLLDAVKKKANQEDEEEIDERNSSPALALFQPKKDEKVNEIVGNISQQLNINNTTDNQNQLQPLQALMNPATIEKFQDKPSVLMSKLVKVQTPQNQDQSDSEQNTEQSQRNILSLKMESYLRKMIEMELQLYFEKIVSEAKDKNKNQSVSMRELVEIKVGIKFLQNQKAIDAEEKKILKENLNRSKMSNIYKSAQQLCESNYFVTFTSVTILLNILILSLSSYPDNYQIDEITQKSNIIFVTIFAIEMIIKLLAFGVKNYFKGQPLNCFDCINVIASLVDLILSFVLSQDSYNSKGNMITTLRGFRLLRIFRLAKQWKRFDLLLETLGKSLGDVVDFTAFLILCIFICSLLALDLFAYECKVDPSTNQIDPVNGVSPTFNFDTFLNSFSLVFIILTNDGQSAIYYTYYRAVGAVSTTIFFVLLVIVGQKVILNLFVAILLQNFDEGSLRQKLQDYKDQQLSKAINQGGGQGWLNKIKQKYSEIKRRMIRKFEEIDTQIDSEFSSSSSDEEEIKGKYMRKNGIFKQEDKKIKKMKKSETILEKSTTTIKKFRKIVKKIVKSMIFKLIIIGCIILSSVQLALTNPLKDPSSDLFEILNDIEITTSAAFVTEACLKILAYGLILNGPKSYFRQFNNIVDFTIIIVSFVSYAPVSGTYRTMRVIRILRIISRNEGLKVAIKALYQSIPKFVNVSMIMILYLLIFGVILVSQFKGKFFSCQQTQFSYINVSSKWDCLNSGNEWTNQIYTFDDILNAMVTIFVMSTTAGWQDILLHSITATEIDFVADTYRSPLWTVIFIIIMVIGNFFFLNLFIGVIVSTFNSEQDIVGGNYLLTEKQREWIDLKLLIFRSQPIRKIHPPEKQWKMIFYKISTHRFFDIFIAICILLNTVALMCFWYDQSSQIQQIFELINKIFAGIFIVEAIIKIIGYSSQVYFSEGWNRFDFIIAVGSIISLVVSEYSSVQIKGTTMFLRSFRLLRILRILKRGGKKISMIFNTFVITLHTLVNIGSLLLLILYIYAVVGMFVLGKVKRNGIINDYINFENIGNAFMTLFVITTGDSWNAIQASYVVENTVQSNCIWNPSYDDYVNNGYQTIGCNSKVVSYSFFTSFFFLINLIFLQLFIAVILKGYDQTQIQEDRLFNNEISDHFRKTWADFDPKATTFIKIEQLRDFLFALGGPLGFDESYREYRFFQDKFIAQMELPTYYDFSKYQFLDVLEALSFRLMVLEKINEQKQEEQEEGEEVTGADIQTQLLYYDKKIEKEIKSELSKEINKLIYQQDSKKILVMQDIVHNEESLKDKSSKEKHNAGFTSAHHMAAETVIKKIKKLVRQRKNANTVF